MNEPKASCTPFDSAHHKDTSLGDTFGGLGVCDEVCEEDARALRLARAERFPDHGTHSAADSPRTHDTVREVVAWPPVYSLDWDAITHESTHDKP